MNIIINEKGILCYDMPRAFDGSRIQKVIDRGILGDSLRIIDESIPAHLNNWEMPLSITKVVLDNPETRLFYTSTLAACRWEFHPAVRYHREIESEAKAARGEKSLEEFLSTLPVAPAPMETFPAKADWKALQDELGELWDKVYSMEDSITALRESLQKTSPSVKTTKQAIDFYLRVPLSQQRFWYSTNECIETKDLQICRQVVDLIQSLDITDELILNGTQLDVRVAPQGWDGDNCLVVIQYLNPPSAEKREEFELIVQQKVRDWVFEIAVE